MFYLERFDTLELPLLEARQTTSSGDSRSPYRALQGGGGLRVLGMEKAPREISKIQSSGEYLEDSVIDTEALAFDLKGLRGDVRKLYRRTKGTQQTHWCWAELMRVGSENSVNVVLEEPLSCDFTMLSPCWYGDHHGGETWVLDSGVELDTGRTLDEEQGDIFALPIKLTPGTEELEIVNAGNHPINNAIITITAGADPIEAPIILETDTGTELYFLEDIPATKALVIDCGARSVTLDGVAAYGSLEVQADHSAVGWLTLQRGTTTLAITYHADSAGTLAVDFSDGHE